MSIQKTDIKLMASERLTDYADGGGEMTGSEIIDGQVNNLFPDISRLDRVYGRVSLRKGFAAAMTDNTDMYYGAHTIVTQPPEDDNVHVTLFTRNDFYDVRDDAKNRIESYVSIAHELPLRPLNDQLEGQRAITCFCQLDAVLPKIGDTIVLKNITNNNQQYLRITDISSQRQTFAKEGYGNFTVQVVTLELSAALQHTFPGIDATPYYTKADTQVHATVVADASSYYGVKKVAQPINQGDMSLWASSIYNQLVPTSQIETPLVDQLMGGDKVAMIAKGAAGALTFSGTRSNMTNIVHLPDGVLPGSLQLTVAGYDFTDQRGSLAATGASDGGFSGTVDYASGQVTINRTSSWSGSVAISATPAVAVSKAFISMEIAVDLANRAYNYTPMLVDPLPSPGSVTVSYMAQGKWYELYDDGHGVFVSVEEGVGTGTLDYASGSVVITLGALPDVGSSVIIHWGHSLDITDLSGSTVEAPALVEYNLTNTETAMIDKGSCTISWDGGSKSLTETNGVFSGDGVGYISYGRGKVKFIPTVIPESGSDYVAAFRGRPEATSTVHKGDLTLSADGNTLTGSLPAPVFPGSVYIKVTTKAIVARLTIGAYRYADSDRAYRDDGQGNIYRDHIPTPIGTVNYDTGAISFTGLRTYSYWAYHDDDWHKPWKHSHWQETATETFEGAEFHCVEAVASEFNDQTITITSPPITIDLCSQTHSQVVPQSVDFTLGGHSFYDDGMGNVYRDKATDTGVGALCGTINYNTGIVELTSYPELSGNTVSISSLLVTDNGFTPRGFVFRCPGAPVRDGSLSLRATLPDGTLLNAVAGNDGHFDHDKIVGDIDTSTGVVRVKFGELVPAAGNENEDWYNADLVDNGQIYRPLGVIPETALYNCVVYSFLPLDAALLGIEPIRLPLDGRVPVFKSGDVAVIHHTSDELLPDNLTAGQQITLARDRLALCDITDQNGNLVAETNYTVNLDTGVLTMADPLDLSAYTQPLVAAARIEDMVLIREAQINGLIYTVGPITHDYPADETQISSALIFGDLAARVVRSFTQKTWDNVWQDTRRGDDSTAKYDDLHYPLILTNKGSIAQRWCIKFTSSTTFQVISEKMGIVAEGNTSSDVAPINPATNVPYFRIDYRGWGTGWSTNNCLRFDTSAANAPIWLARTTMQGAVEEPTDEFVLQIRGDAN